MIPATSTRLPARWQGLRLAFLTAFLGLLVCHCHLMSAQGLISQVRQDVVRLEGARLEEPARYHLAVAGGLLVAAEKQYEEADFASASRFAQRAQEQVRRALDLQAFLQEAATPTNEELK